MRVHPKFMLYSAIVAGGAVGPAALVNGEILDFQCDGQIRAGCQGLPPVLHHIEQREPAPPLLVASAVYAFTTSSTPENYGKLLSGPSGISGSGHVTPGPNAGVLKLA
jgi:hypothetical protein